VEKAKVFLWNDDKVVLDSLARFLAQQDYVGLLTTDISGIKSLRVDIAVLGFSNNQDGVYAAAYLKRELPDIEIISCATDDNVPYGDRYHLFSPEFEKLGEIIPSIMKEKEKERAV